MKGTLNVIYYVPVSDDGRAVVQLPLAATYNKELDAWVDPDNRTVIKFFGLVIGDDSAYASPRVEDVENWIVNPKL